MLPKMIEMDTFTKRKTRVEIGYPYRNLFFEHETNVLNSSPLKYIIFKMMF